MTKETILEALGTVLHPGRGDKSIVELGMVQNLEFTDKSVNLTLVFPKRRDPLAEYLISAARAALFRIMPEGSGINVQSVVEQADETAKKSTKELGLEQLSEVRHIVGVASGKGGVGKSTVAVNLACALARAGYRVGLADADVYGPSVPTMTGTEREQVKMLEEGESQLFVPVEKYGVKWMSIGYFADRGQALIWRGPMACSALKQMILQVKWGTLDYLLIDMPPGTGDIHISLLQDIPVEGAVIVTTPQNVALADVEKGVDMFSNPNVKRPIFGLVENMSWFTPAEHPDEKYYIFGRDGGRKMAEELGVNLLAQIPLVQSIRENADAGEPAALGSGPDAAAFAALASALVDKTE
ncbi:MAG: Mrp/NBP35 family ATP-binding protein [Bacteroidales bacterium]|nr:Mrp/NBP35 family ATP-binding protein [Bacteroidales bacterium]